MEYYEVEVDCMQYCYGGSAKFTVDPNGYGEWAKRADVELLIADRDRLAAENAELRYWKQGNIRCAAQLAAATATLDALREAIRRQHAELFYMTAAQYLSVGFDAKKETDNG